jgi:F-type H+-transporting ATPase subunit delta
MEEISRVYARSLFQVATEHDKLDTMRDQLDAFADAVSESRDLSTFLFSPYFSTEEKKEGLRKAVVDADPEFVNFLEVLAENHRMPVIFRIRRDFDAMWEDAHKLLPVDVTSAFELDERIVKSIGDRIGEQTGRKVDLNAHVDPDILGGIVLRVGNSVLDASIKNRLNRLRRQIAQA